MRYGTIMVAVDPGAAARDRVRLAGHLSDAFGAHLVGVAARQLACTPPAGGPPVDAYVLPRLHEACLDGLASAHALFMEAASGRSRLAWHADIADPLCFLLRRAAGADLVVAGRPDEAGQAYAADLGDLVMNLGRPLLVVPAGIDHLAASRVAIGWRNTREARRAVSDALPFLRRAAKVVVLGIDAGDPGCDGRPAVGFLERHGIEADAVRIAPCGAATAEALVEHACEHAADLLVVGAYGHSRLREWAFGGVTRDLLRACPIGCLLSH